MRDLIAKYIGNRIEEVITQIIDGDLKKDNIVYCTKKLDYVIFLEPPSESLIKKYLRAKEDGEIDPPFQGDIIYKTSKGEIRSAPAACIVKISNGNYCSEYEFKGKNREVNSKNKEILARQAGFRTERIRCDNSTLLKIYGDSQVEVDDFISLVCQNDFQIY
jgi:hypothetical protein